MVTRLMHPVVMALITLTRFVEKRSIITTMDIVSISTVMSTERPSGIKKSPHSRSQASRIDFR